MKECEELKTLSGVRIQVNTTVDFTALSMEVKHTFKTVRQAVINQHTIPVQEWINLVAQRLGQSVQFFSNDHYSNTAGVAINAVVWPANAALGHYQCLSPILAAGLAAQTRPGRVHFFMVDTTIRKTGKLAVITQSFALPQGTWEVTWPNGTTYVTHGYMGDDPLNITASIFNLVVLEPKG